MIADCIVIDDEPLAVSKLAGFIGKMGSLRLAATFDNAVDAISWLRENHADLIFLDIQMEQLTGIQFLEAINSRPFVIITSAYDQYAVKSFELNVADYLLKPFSFQRFVQAVDKVLELVGRDHKNNDIPASDDGYMFVKTEYRLERINYDEILYIEGMRDYLRIVCSDRKIMTLQSFAKIDENLPNGKFCRVHKSYIVALDKIKAIERGVICIGDQRIPVSNTYKDTFYSRLKL